MSVGQRNAQRQAPLRRLGELIEKCDERIREGQPPVNTKYRKSGIVFFGLEKAGAAYQTDLFAPAVKHEKSKLYESIDALNAKLGKGKVFSAAEGVGKPAWAMKRSKLSKRATTNWDELLTVR